jgi:predicted dehydrogenase
MSNSKLGVAVVGAGYWGPNLIRNFTACPATDVRWLCDLNEARARKVAAPYPATRVSASLDEVLADDNVEAVAIATPVGAHADLAARCLEAGRHVLVEKPLARTVAEGEALCELAARKGLTLMADHTFCYTGVVRKMRELISSGAIGDVLYFDSVRVNLGLFQSDVNVLWDLAPHDLSILDFILPADLKPVAVSAQGSDVMKTGYESVAYLTLHFDTGAIGHVHASWLSPVKIRTTLVGGTRKMLVWDDNTPMEKLRVYDKGVDLRDADPEARRDVLVSYRTGDMWAPTIDGREALGRMVGEFAAAVAERRAPETDGLAGLRVLRALAAADESIRRGGLRVPLNG